VNINKTTESAVMINTLMTNHKRMLTAVVMLTLTDAMFGSAWAGCPPCVATAQSESDPAPNCYKSEVTPSQMECFCFLSCNEFFVCRTHDYPTTITVREWWGSGNPCVFGSIPDNEFTLSNNQCYVEYEARCPSE